VILKSTAANVFSATNLGSVLSTLRRFGSIRSSTQAAFPADHGA
jgi:hypothetical protein